MTGAGSSSLSPERRSQNLAHLSEETHDILVIGGGITGAAAAHAAALRGYRVALVEKDDFASGTSSRSSKLIHGGLRYLEQFDFGLVFEALRERELLIETAPHLITPRRFLLPIYEDSRTGPFLVRIGVALYDLLAGWRSIGRREWFDPNDAPAVEPLLQREGLRGLVGYYDATTNDARHTLTVIRSAARAGAVTANYVRVTDLRREGESVTGARVRDERTGSELEIRARAIVNASGVWASGILAMADERMPGALRPSKGSHIVVPRERLRVRNALIFESPVDGRVMFVIPWGWFTLIGTTEVEYDGRPDRVQASPDEVAYILESVRKPIPEPELEPLDVSGTYSGIRPLVAEEGEAAGTTSREHSIIERPAGLLTVVGGKFTTHRLMGEQVIDRAAQRLEREFGIAAASPARTRDTALVGAPRRSELEVLRSSVARRAGRIGLPMETEDHLVRRYGTESHAILDRIETEPDLGELLAPPLPYTAAEAHFAVDQEMTLGLTDFMTRRTHLVYAGGPENLAIAERAARHLGDRLGWDRADRDAQMGSYAAERSQRRAPLEGAASLDTVR